MGFFNDIGAVFGEINSFKDELSDTVKKTVDDITSSTNDIKSVGTDAVEKVSQTSQDLKDKIKDTTKL